MPTYTWQQLTTQGNWLGQNWDWSTRWPDALPLDPYLVWADVTKRIDFDKFKRSEVPIIVEFFSTAVAQTAIGRLTDVNIGNAKVADIYVTSGGQNDWKLIGNTRFATAFAGPEFFKKFATNHQGNFNGLIKRFALSLPVDADGVSASGVRMMAFPANTRVVLGLIDDGLTFANPATSERIQNYWDQESGRERLLPEKFNYGAEYGLLPDGTHKKADWIRNSTNGGKLDEEEVYRRARLTQLRRRTTHGSAVLGVAAGADPADDRVALVCVQLPSNTTKDTSGASLSTFVLDGLHYILLRAELGAPGRGLPVVANLSYGDFAGPHDGSSMLEAAVDDLVDACSQLGTPVSLSVVVPAGNSMQGRCHASFQLDNNAGLSKTLEWRVLPDDVTPSFMEIWLPPKVHGRTIGIVVTPPGGPANPTPATIGRHFGMGDDWTNGEPVCCVVFPRFSAKSNGVRRMILVAIAPTASLTTRSLAPAGRWRVTVTSTSAIAGTVDAWIQRDDAPYGYPKKGRQSYFDDPNYVRFTQNGVVCETDDDTSTPFEGDRTRTYVKRTGTLNAIATGRRLVVVGGYRKTDKPDFEKPAKYSSSGPAIRAGNPPAPPPAPLLSQVSEDSLFHHGVLAGGTHSGATTAFNGTSIAAPQVANELWKAMAVGGNPGLTQTAGTPSNRVRVNANSAAGAYAVGPLQVTLAQGTTPDDRKGLGLDQAPVRTRSGKRREVD